MLFENPVFTEPDFEPNIFIYDNYPGGIGLSPGLFELEKTLLQHALKTINVCPCQEGCPSCVGPSRETSKQATQGRRISCEGSSKNKNKAQTTRDTRASTSTAGSRLRRT
ncbi:MAG: DUF1998 domain-containing protein [Acidobacteriota bacterium]